MAEDDKNEEQSPLSPEQRLDILEKKVGSNKVILLAVALFLIVVISVSVTVFAVGIFGNSDSNEESQAQLTQVQQDIDGLKEQLLNLDTRLAKFGKDLELQDIKLANSGNRVIQATLVEQEQNYQTFLSSLRSAIYDLAHMVPGSRAWLELYSDQIDQSIAHSQTRVNKLKDIESSEEKVDSFFGDF